MFKILIIANALNGYKNKKKYAICVSKKCCEEKHIDLLLIEEGEKKTLCSQQ